MGMSAGQKRGKKGRPQVMGEMNTTPLIDVMLVLLVMLIITIPIQLHSVDLNMPNNNTPPSQVKPEIVQIGIDFDGTLSVNGVIVPNIGALEARMRTMAAQANQPEIQLQPNKLAHYDSVAAVLAAAQRLGLKKIGIVGNEEYN